MRIFTLAILISIACAAEAKKDYPLTAKVKSVEAESSGGGGTIGFEQVRISGAHYKTVVQIGERIYTSTWACSMALAGESYPARIEVKKKLFGPPWREIHMRVEGRDCYIVVTGSEEGR